MGRFFLILMLPLILSLAIPVQGFAADTGRPEIDPLLWEFIGETRVMRDMLQSKSPADWTDQELEEYFYSAAFVPYYALILHVRKYMRHPSSQLELLEWMGEDDWPGNPLNGWEPMTLVYDDPAFSAGNLVVLLCPPEWNSKGMYGSIVPLTFNISVFGPREDFVPERELLTPYDFMPGWPDGTVWGLCGYFGPIDNPLL